MDALTLLGLIALFQIKHFAADYLLQGKYMLGKFKLEGWFLPLLSHSLVHMGLTLFILVFYIKPEYALLLSILDMLIHFTIDRVKVLASRGYDSAKDKEFWWWLGADQMAHHFTHYGIAFAALCIGLST